MIKTYSSILIFICLSFPGTKGYAGPAYDNNLNIRLVHQQLFALHPFTSQLHYGE